MAAANDPAVTRRLAAILIADVVGYTRLMERDDTGTFARLRIIRDEVVDPAVISHGGRVVRTVGDGLMAEFGSALSALRTAVHLQREMVVRNADVPVDERIEYRIGINLGDVMVDGSDLAGDGINVAARLETLCEPGGICVSGSVREQVHGTLDVRFDDIGEQQVKNIARPIRAFAVRFGGANESPRASPTARTGALAQLTLRSTSRWVAFAIVVSVAAFALTAQYSHLWPFRGDVSPAPPAMSVGVIPLVAQAGDPATAQRVASMTRDLTSQLALADVAIRAVPATVQQSGAANRGGIGELARALNVQYVLEGEIQPAQTATDIRLRLVNGASGEQIWSETVSMKEPVAAGDQTRTLRVAMEHLRDRLFHAEIQRVAKNPERAMTAMDYVLRANALEKTEKSLDRLRREEAFYEEALRRDPDFVPALLGIVGVFDGQLDLDANVDRERLVRRMDEVTTRAVNLNRAAPDTWGARAGALMYMGRWDAALEASANAIQLDPDASWLVSNRAWLMSLAGRPAEAVALVAQAVAMDPAAGWWKSRVGCEAHLLLGQYDDAIAACEKAAGQTGDDFDIAYFLAAAYSHKGRTERAAQEKAKILRRAPGFTIAALRAKRYSVNPEYMRLAEEHWYSGLRKAGIPEK